MKETFDKILKVQQEFADLYRTSPLIAISSTTIFLEEKGFEALFPEYNVRQSPENPGYNILSTKYNGIEIIAIKPKKVKK